MSRTIQHYQVCILYMFVFYETYHDLHVFGSLSVCSLYLFFKHIHMLILSYLSSLIVSTLDSAVLNSFVLEYAGSLYFG